YSAYRAIRSNMSVGHKVMAVAEIALPFAARPLAEVVVNATGVQTSVELVTAGIALAPTGLRVAAGVVKGTANAITFAYNKCCGSGKVVKEAANETETLDNTAATREVEVQSSTKEEVKETPVLQIPEIKQEKPVLVRRSSKE